jgi:hypothetical protein
MMTLLTAAWSLLLGVLAASSGTCCAYTNYTIDKHVPHSNLSSVTCSSVTTSSYNTSSLSTAIARPTKYDVTFDRLFMAGPMSDEVDCQRCVKAVLQLHPGVGDKWFWQHVRSCYRCKTSHHPVKEKKSTDLDAAQFLFTYHGLPSHSPTVMKGVKQYMGPCSVQQCQQWIQSNPVLGPRLFQPDETTKGLQACYACQFDPHATTSVAFEQLFAQLSNIMFRSTIPSAPQLAERDKAVYISLGCQMLLHGCAGRVTWTCMQS